MNTLFKGVTNVIVLLAVFGVVFTCSASHNLKDYAERSRTGSIQRNSTYYMQTENKTESSPSSEGSKSSDGFQTGNPSENSTNKIQARSMGDRKRRRRRIDSPYLVVQHSLMLGNFTLVKTPMMANFDAYKYCQRDGGQLAAVKSHKDIEVLRTLLELSSFEQDRYIYEAYVNVPNVYQHPQHSVYDYHGYDAIPVSSFESSEALVEDKCTTLRKEGMFNKVDCSWSLAFFCQPSNVAAFRP